MRRKTKNIIQLILILILIITSGITIWFARTDTINHLNERFQELESSTTQNNQKPPEKPEENEENQTPTKPENDKQDSNSPFESDNNQQDSNSSDNPSGNSSFNENKPLTGKEDQVSFNIQNNKFLGNENNLIPVQLQLPNIDMNTFKEFVLMSSSYSFLQISFWYYFLFIIQSFFLALILIYLVMSRFNKKTFGQTFKNMDKLTIFLLSLIVYTTIFTVVDVFITRNLLIDSTAEIELNEDISESDNPNKEDLDITNATGKETIDNTSKTLTTDYETSNADQSVILVKNNGEAIIKNVTLNKSGDTTDMEASEFYGLNAGVLVNKSKAEISDSTIITDAKGANAVFSTGTDSSISLKNTEIKTSLDGSRGLDATYSGTIKGESLNIQTQGNSSAALATDRGEGTIEVSNSTLETNSPGSPLIYSTGSITVNDSSGKANKAQIGVVEGKNSITLNNSQLSGTGQGNRGNTDEAGIMIYQSMSGDAGTGQGSFTAKDSKLEIQSDSDSFKTAPLFFITNTQAKINIENCQLNYGSDTLISAKGTDEWGENGKNGGELEFSAKNQTLEGKITADDISTIKMDLSQSTLKGQINSENTAKEINLTLDASSTLELTGDSYITNLDNEDQTGSNIKLNGFKLFINDKEYNTNES